MKGYGVDIYAPRKPYVTTTILIQRPFGWVIGPCWRVIPWLTNGTMNRVLGSSGAGRDSPGNLHMAPARDWDPYDNDRFGETLGMENDQVL